MEGPSTSAPTLESSESQIRRLKEANKSIIDIKRYVDEIKSTLPTRIQEKQEELSLQLPQMLLPKEKQVNSLLAKLPPQVSTAKILEKAGQLKTVLQLLHLHNQSGKLIREATILNSGTIEVAQRPFLVRRHAYAAILMKADTQTQLSSLFTDCATTAGGDIGYFSVDGRIYEKLFNGLKPSFSHYEVIQHGLRNLHILCVLHSSTRKCEIDRYNGYLCYWLHKLLGALPSLPVQHRVPFKEDLRLLADHSLSCEQHLMILNRMYATYPFLKA